MKRKSHIEKFLEHIEKHNKFIKESLDGEQFIKDIYLELQDLGFEFLISNQTVSGKLIGKYQFDEVIELYREFILRLESEFYIKQNDISFKENEVTLNLNLIENSLEGLKDSIILKLDGEEKIFKIINIRRDMIDVLKKTYLSGLQFSISNSSETGFIRFWINWELNWKDVKNNAKKHNRIFINPEILLSIKNTWFHGTIEIDKESANKFYKYFEESGGWKYGYNDDSSKVDFTNQSSSDDLEGVWNYSTEKRSSIKNS